MEGGTREMNLWGQTVVRQVPNKQGYPVVGMSPVHSGELSSDSRKQDVSALCGPLTVAPPKTVTLVVNSNHQKNGFFHVGWPGTGGVNPQEVVFVSVQTSSSLHSRVIYSTWVRPHRMRVKR